MTTDAYVVTLLRNVPWSPLMLTRIGTEHRDIPTREPSLLAAAEAILADYTGRPWSSGDAAAFAAMVFSDDGPSTAQTIRGESVARFVDAVGRERAA